MLKVVGKNFVCRVAVAWRKGNYAGVRIEQVGKLVPKAGEVPMPQAPAVDPSYKAIGTRRTRVSTI